MPDDPMTGFQFSVEVDGIENAYFTECSGLGGQVEVFEYKEGGLNTYSHKLPGRTTYGNIQLKRGITGTSAMWTWFSNIVSAADKTSHMKSVSITQYKPDGTVIQRWNLANAYPVKWTGPKFDAASAAITVEEFELAFGDLTLGSP